MRFATLLLLAAWLASAQTATIHGVVKDQETGDPIPEFKVQAPGAEALTDAEGRYVLPRLAPGSLTITARDLRRDSVIKTVNVTANENLSLDFLIPPNATISGRLLDEDNQPVSGTEIWVVKRDSLRQTLMGPQVSKRDGRFTFDYGFDAHRKYYLIAQRPPAVGARPPEPPPINKRQPVEVSTYFGNTISFETATPIILKRGEHFETVIKIRQSPWYCADGQVVVSGQPAAVRFAVQELALAGTQLARQTGASAKDGSFHVCNLTPGRYRLSLRDMDLIGAVDFAITNSDVRDLRLATDFVALRLQLVWDGEPPAAPADTGTSALTRRSADVKQLQENLTALARLRTGISVRLDGIDNDVRAILSQAVPFDGSVGTFFAGDYQLQVSATQPRYIKELSYNGLPCPDRRLQLTPGSGTLRIVVGQDGGTVQYSVTDADGNLMPSADVVLFPVGDSPDPIPGAGRSQGLAPGRYRALAIDRPTFPEDLEKLRSVLFQAKEIEVQPKAKLKVSLRAISID